MNSLGLSFEHLFKEEKKSKARISTPHQALGLEYAKKLGVKNSKDIGQIIRLIKRDANKAAKAYSFAIDYPNCRSPLKIFFWKYYH